MNHSFSYLRALHGAAVEEGLYFCIWEKKTKRSFFYNLLPPATARAQAGGTDLYASLGAFRSVPTNGGRGTAAQVAVVAGVWADIDHGDHGNGKCYPPDRAAAIELAESMGVEPTMVVDSGRGIHAYWLFREPLEAAEAAPLVRGWILTLSARAWHRGWAVDHVFDIARVLRVPGTINSTTGTAAQILRLDDQRRYNPDELWELVADVPDAPTPAPDASDLELDSGRQAPHAEELAREDARFARTWNREREDLSDQSASGYDQAVAGAGVRRSWTDQQIADAIIVWRTRHGDRPEKALRSDYIARTIGTARAGYSGDGAEPERSAPDILQAGGILELDKDSEAGAIERALRAFGNAMSGVRDKVTSGTARALAINRLKAIGLSSPAKTVDAAIRAACGHNEEAAPGQERGAGPYGADEKGIYRISYREDDQGNVTERRDWLTNFLVRIAADIVRDDGLERQRALELEADVRGRRQRFVLPAADFAAMNWVVEHLGAHAIVMPGRGIKDEARAAIQHLSSGAPQRLVYTHLGWRRIGKELVFLTASGALGADGLRQDVDVDVPQELSRYELPDPPTVEACREGIRASFALLDLGQDDLLAPMLAAAYRVVLAPADLALHLHGPTNTFKTESAVLILQHFGPRFTGKGLTSWSGTGHSLEVIAFHAKDVVLLVDDFVPSGTAHEVARKHQDAERLLRGQGNRSGRSRLRADGSLRPTRHARGLIVSTGEEVPRGQSLGTRFVGLPFEHGAIEEAPLHEAQERGRDGLYAAAMSGYVAWLAPRLKKVRKRLRERVVVLRDEVRQLSYRRMAANAAELCAGTEVFLDFAVEIGAIDEAQAIELRERFWRALLRAETRHADHVVGSDPATRFLELLRSALTAGLGHLTDTDGEAPSHAEGLGWRRTAVRRRQTEEEHVYTPLGEQVGWVDDDDVYLDRDTAVRVAQRAAASAGEGVPVDGRTLLRRLKDKRVLASTEEKRDRLTVRKTLGGRRREVVHIRMEALYPADSGPLGRSAWDGGTVEPPDRPTENADGGRAPDELGRLGRSHKGKENYRSGFAADEPPDASASEPGCTDPPPHVRDRPNRPTEHSNGCATGTCGWDGQGAAPSRTVPTGPTEVDGHAGNRTDDEELVEGEL